MKIHINKRRDNMPWYKQVFDGNKVCVLYDSEAKLTMLINNKWWLVVKMTTAIFMYWQNLEIGIKIRLPKFIINKIYF